MRSRIIRVRSVVMERWQNKLALVTGAAAGIGSAITIALLKNGINVIGLDLQVQRLYETYETIQPNLNYPAILYPYLCDLSNGLDIEKAFQWIDNKFEGIDILINNVGIIDHRRIIDSDRQTFEKMLNVNVLSMAISTSKVVQSMLKRKVEGHIFNINSVLGHELRDSSLSDIDGLNGFNLYPACKHASVALTHTVRRELKAVNAPIRITSISPGLCKTEICKSTNMKDIIADFPMILPEDVADAIVYALGTRSEVQITELTIQHRGEI